MFIHAFRYRIKILLNNKSLIFWTLFFPIILGSLFYVALANIGKSEVFHSIDIAVINNEEFNNDENFKASIYAASDESSSDKMFNLTLTSVEEASSLLEDDKISAYILLDNGINLIVKDNGLAQTILKSYLDTYVQTSTAIVNIINSNPERQVDLMNSLDMSATHTNSVKKDTTDSFLHYFYTLIAMACLYAANWGSKEVCDIQANLSPTAARLNMVPVHKLKIFLANIFAAFLFAFIEILALIAFLNFVLKIDFGSKIGFVILTAFVGAIVGISLGACLSSLLTVPKQTKVSIIMAISMLQSFLAGMMVINIKYYIKTNIPLLSYLNPANLLTDAYYYLYNYSTLKSYFINIGLLSGFMFIFIVISYLKLRRQKYASL